MTVFLELGCHALLPSNGRTDGRVRPRAIYPGGRNRAARIRPGQADAKMSDRAARLLLE